jgi:excinuclease ABC subunit B
MSEDLTDYLLQQGVKVKYLHADVDTIDRTKILHDLRVQKYDCVVGVNLLREGLDLPEVSLVVIFDADKQGFLRSATSLIQTAGRAARHVEGRVIMYADSVSSAMKEMLDECQRRREIQLAYNKEHGITPRSIQKAIKAGIEQYATAEEIVQHAVSQNQEEYEIFEMLGALEQEMQLAARNLEFERAAKIRDKINQLKLLKDNK